ncbi:MAG TPA: class I tRNA ligase family protein, partial [Jiangellaceae bacterium]|nr:class I tRNA ligase family protein [Jiangellaceae bacterium]
REKFYPNQVLVTGYDILFFWVARMMMFGLYAHQDKPAEEAVPFRVVALHGLVRDQFGKKMTKSAGNAVDPIVWLDKYGADGVRFTMARGANPGADVPIGEDWVQASRNFCNKLWNATRFALLNGARVGPLPSPAELSGPDRWIVSRLNRTVAAVDAFYEDFQFAKASEALFHFAWDEFCDWYVELAKTPLAAGGAAAEPTRLVLGNVLDTLLRLLHPVIPFVTEQLWTTMTGDESLVIASWPTADESRTDAAAEAAVAEVQRLVTEVRRFRSDQGLKPRQRVMAQLVGHAGGPAEAHETEIRSLTWLDPPSGSFAPTASLQVGPVTVEVDVSGAIDLAAERRRVDKDLAVARAELAQAAAKLDNEQFLAKAPEPVVIRIRERRTAAEAEIARLEARLVALR